ncbi:MAG: squalene--hopene cyclase, partial [Pirellula sp.]
GFLEAIPLTSFVAIAMIAAGERHHAVVGKGIDFLLDTFRTDGSWAIDTHLATWVSTLSVNALSHSERLLPLLSQGEYLLKQWIIDQQYKQVHPFTNAAPGGWSWTPLSGGVPDADDTPGAMLALRAFYDSASTDDDRSRLTETALAGGLWLVNLQNSDGGIPTFCKGWGTLPFDRSNPDITAHALRAWLAWYDLATTPAQKRMRASIFKAMRFLKQRQRDDGAWVPLWFGNQYVQDEENLTYGTSRVLLAWLAASKTDWLKQKLELDIDRRILLGGDWLIQAQQEDGSWTGGDRNSLQPAYKQAEPSLLGSIEETSLAVESLAELALHLRKCSTGNPEDSGRLDACQRAIERGVAWIAQRTNTGTEFPPSPIGFYFAKLWYYEKHYPICYSVAALERVAKMMRDGR